MHTRTLKLTAAVALGAATVAGAGAGLAGGSDGRRAARVQATPTPLPQGAQPVRLDPADFTTRVDNPYFPLRPGTRWVYRGTTPRGAVERIVDTVMHRTHKVAGIRVRVVHDVARGPKGRRIEDTHDWYAQDRAGNVWYLGEATTEFRHGRPASTEGSWAAGVGGAQAGVIMPAAPAAGLAYRQEYLKGQAEDNGQVLGLGERVTVPFGRFRHVLTTRDTTALDPYDVEYKFYAPGIGQVLGVGIAGDPEREDLVSFKRGAR